VVDARPIPSDPSDLSEVSQYFSRCEHDAAFVCLTKIEGQICGKRVDDEKVEIRKVERREENLMMMFDGLSSVLQEQICKE
jgi:hypothetical protein